MLADLYMDNKTYQLTIKKLQSDILKKDKEIERLTKELQDGQDTKGIPAE